MKINIPKALGERRIIYMNKRQVKKYINRVNDLFRNSRENGVAMKVLYQFSGKHDENGIPHYYETRKKPSIEFIK